MDAGERRQLGKLALGGLARVRRELAQERHDLGWRIGHLGCERILGVIAEANEVGGFVAQREDVLDIAAVVPPGVGALV